MDINVTNYSLYKSTCRQEEEIGKNFTHHDGCNAFVRRISEDFLYFIVPEKLINETIEEINRKCTSSYTLDMIIGVFNEMNFHYDYKLIEKPVIFQDRTYSNYYVFTLTGYSNRIIRYYAFCMIRHFYYYQDILIDYMVLYEQCKTELEKIVSLYISSKGCPNVFMGSLPATVTTFKEVLVLFNHHNNVPASIYVSSLVSSYDSIRKLASTLSTYSNNVVLSVNLCYFKKSFYEIISKNIFPKKFARFMDKRYSSYDHSDFVTSIPVLDISTKRKVIISPIKLNIKKSSINSYNILYPDTEYSINMEVISRKENCLNNYKAINNLKKTKVLDVLCKQSKDMLENYNTHYLFFSNRGLFLHQVQKEGYIMDSNFEGFKDYELKESMIKHFHDIFSRSGLDIGVFTVKISNDDYYVTQLSPFRNNGEYSLIKYINELKYVWSSRILS